MGPVAPVAPVAPVVPVPAGPVAPVAPVAPVGSVIPVKVLTYTVLLVEQPQLLQLLHPHPLNPPQLLQAKKIESGLIIYYLI